MTKDVMQKLKKEMLTIVHTCEKFQSYIFGKEVTMYKDHKFLEQIMKKPPLAATERPQRMILNLSGMTRKGKEMYLPDTTKSIST